MDAQNSHVVSTVHLQEVVDDYAADMDGDGDFDGNIANTPDHRYGSSGIDGTAFGPKFGRADGKQYLTVAYGIYKNVDRVDNDHQVLLQYDTSKWAALTKASTDTALRDITDLVERGVLTRDEGGGRSTSYSLVAPD